MCLSQPRTWISNIICRGRSYVQWFDVRGNCSFYWYWWNCWPSLFKLSFHNNIRSISKKNTLHDVMKFVTDLKYLTKLTYSIQWYYCIVYFLLVIFVLVIVNLENKKNIQWSRLLYIYQNPRPAWSWSYGCWIYNCLCNQCISPLTLWVRIPLRWSVLDTTLCDKVCQ